MKFCRCAGCGNRTILKVQQAIWPLDLLGATIVARPRLVFADAQPFADDCAYNTTSSCTVTAAIAAVASFVFMVIGVLLDWLFHKVKVSLRRLVWDWPDLFPELPYSALG